MGANEALKFPLVDGRKLLLQTLQRFFPGCCGCTYTVRGNDEPIVVDTDSAGNLQVPDLIDTIYIALPGRIFSIKLAK